MLPLNRRMLGLVLVLAAVVVVAFVGTSLLLSPRGPPTFLPLPTGTVLAFGPNVSGVSILPQPGGASEYGRAISFTVGPGNGTLVGAWTFDSPAYQVYAVPVPQTNVTSWGSMLSPMERSPLHVALGVGDWVLGFGATGPGNLTVTQTIQIMDP